MNKQQGFNIVEVLIALLIISLVIGAVAKVASSSLQYTSDIQDEAFANWVALNQISEAQLQKTGVGLLTGKSEMGGHQWFWEQDIRPTLEQPALLEIDVKVFREEGDEEVYASVKGFRKL